MTTTGAPFSNADGGEQGEAATAALISDVLGGELAYQHTPGEAPQGIDVAYLEDGELHVAEVKSVIGDWHQSSTSLTVDGRQMDANCVADLLDRIGVEADPSVIGDGEGQVRTDLFQVDFPGDTIARYNIDTEGRRADTSPSEIYALSDVMDIHEAANVADLVDATDSTAENIVDATEVEGEGDSVPEGGPSAL